ncbi:MAG: right-handed parallel beta-helix repeat-containing protein [Phycisphaerales bacterium JB037]
MHHTRARSSRRATAALIALTLLGSGVILAVAGPLDPPAGPPAPTMKTLDQVEPRTPVESLPGDATSTHIISQPGSYYLTRNLQGESGKVGIRITSDNVTLDLSGFTLTGVPGSLDAINVGNLIFPLDNIHIRNGAVVGWGFRGIDADLANNAIVENIRAMSNGEIGIRVGFGASPPTGPVIRNCVAQNNALHGIQADNAVIENCVAIDNRGRGINVSSSAVRGCVGSANDLEGIGGSGSLVNSSTIGNRLHGVTWSGTVDACRSSANIGDGFVLRPGSTISNSRASENTFAGINAHDGVTVRDNTARDNMAQGILVASNAYITGNNCDDNDLAGIRVEGFSNRIDSNHATNNATGIQVVTIDGNLVIRNSASGNATNFSVPGGNTVGEIITATGNITASTGPWANFSF